MSRDGGRGEGTPGVVRWYLAITLALAILWLAFMSLMALFRVPSIVGISSELGKTLPGITILLKDTYRYFWLIPLLGAIAAIDLIRRRKVPPAYAVAVFAVLAFLGSLMHYILYEGLFAPLLALLILS